MLSNLVCVGPALVMGLVGQTLLAEQSCESLISLKLHRTTITSSVLAPEGPVALPGPARGNQTLLTAPARCVVKGTAKPTTDSEIRFEVWLPVSNWNGKYRQGGNGGWAGAIPTQSLIEPVRRGYATAATDDGHEGSDGA